MAKKKLMVSVTAASAIAATMVGADKAEAASHKVASGDSLWSIAQKYNTSVAQLKKLNNLSGDLIHPNQVLETDKKAATSGSSSSSKKPAANSSAGSGSTYTVKSGDTLSAIAFKHKIPISDLMKWNNLNSTLIYPGNKLTVSKSGSASGGSDKSDSSSNSGSTSNSGSSSNAGSSSAGGNSGTTGSTEVYTVKSGDTLGRIASQHGTTVANLKKWNNLSSDLILIGQKLNIGGKASTGGSSSGNNNSSSDNSNNGNSNSNSNSSGSSGNSGGSSSASADYNVNQLLSTAQSMNGVSYVWGGSSPSGFDCSGFIHYTFKQAGKDMGRLSSAGYFNRAHYVNNPQKGDLVFFEGTYKSGISHMGIYLGNGQFIHAGSSGVEVSSVDNLYWSKHFDSYKRFY